MNVGDYVRDHINGIGKVIKCYNNELEIVFNKARIKTSVSSYFEFSLNKSSPNIIDLIEIGDYVNGMIVHCAYADDDEIVVGGLDILIQDTLVTLRSKNIKSIVTKEQFESIQYKVGD